MTLMNKALTIAGSDTSGGAGMEADIKTMEELGVYGMPALTCIVTMHPTTWEHSVFPLPLDLVEKQLVTAIEGVGIRIESNKVHLLLDYASNHCLQFRVLLTEKQVGAHLAGGVPQPHRRNIAGDDKHAAIAAL